MNGLNRHLAGVLTAERTRELDPRRAVHMRQRELVRASLLRSARPESRKQRVTA
jgi:hypothetical protein